MDMKEIINVCCVRRKISNAELARKMNTSPANLNHKMQRNNFSTDDLEIIAKALDCTLEIKFLDKESGKSLA